jgi:septin family protein
LTPVKLKILKIKVNFNILVVGESGTGKTTFIKNLLKKFQRFMINSYTSNGSENKENQTSRQYIYSEFNKPINEDSIRPGKKTVKYDKFRIKCPTVNKYQSFQFNIIDSPGYGTELNNELWMNDIIQYIQKNVDNYILIIVSSLLFSEREFRERSQ